MDRDTDVPTGIKSVEEVTKDLLIGGKFVPTPRPLPEVKPVTHIQGVPIDEFQKKVEEDRKRLLEVTPEEEMKFLEKDSKLQLARLDNQDLRDGKRPPEHKKWYILAITALTAIATIVGSLKGCGVF